MSAEWWQSSIDEVWAEAQERAEREMGMEHRDGIRWSDAPRPRRLHRCTPWTTGYVGYFDRVERCACGAIRHTGHRFWLERNSRKRVA